MTARDIATHIDIAAAPALVWRVLGGWAAYPEWNPFIVGLHGRQQVGSRLVLSLHPPAGHASRCGRGWKSGKRSTN